MLTFFALLCMLIWFDFRLSTIFDNDTAGPKHRCSIEKAILIHLEQNEKKPFKQTEIKVDSVAGFAGRQKPDETLID